MARPGAPQAASSTELLADARGALDADQFDAAEALALQIPRDDSLWSEGRLIAGEAASKLQRFDDAIAYYTEVPHDGSEAAVLATYARGEICYYIGEITQAIECYEEILRQQPGHVVAHSRLATLLGVTRQRWAAEPHYFALIQHQGWTVQELVLLADLERPIEPEGYLERCLQRVPHDPLVQLAAATADVAASRSESARTRLAEVIVRLPDAVPPRALLGELLLRHSDAEFRAWHALLPAAAENSPDVWSVRGAWFRQQGQLEAAARCFWEAVRLAPSYRRATYELSQVLSALGHAAAADFSARAAELTALTQLLDQVLDTRGGDEAAVRQVVTRLQGLGRSWEAWAWAETAQQAFPSATWPGDVIAAASPQLTSQTPLTIDSANLALRHDLSGLALPVPLIPLPDSAAQTSPLAARSSSLRFDDEAARVGINFVYHNGDTDLESHGTRMFEQSGGGVAVLDFDADGWPDLLFPQGGAWPQGLSLPPRDPTRVDGLYRNRHGIAFSPATGSSRLIDGGFSQGAAVGDFDSDGFPDLYVAQIGRNCLYQSRGDGTWADVTDDAGLTHAEWTASCVLVDLNADGHPDLFDVNYLDGPQIFELLCQGYGCSPKNFAGVPDRLLINQGDGRFVSVPNAAPTEGSKGLGVVAIDLEGQGRLSLVITNDQVPNHLLRNRAQADWPGVQLVDESFLSGFAFNGDGLAMAGMGIAAGDADGDGRTDLFVTNFRDESNTLYQQDALGLFADSTKAAGLAEPSFPYVGWGTQFLDADLDGRLDLVLTNGDVDDYRSTGGLYHMPAQLFYNAGQGRFAEVPAQDAGSYFSRLYLGRGLSRLDWNRDGRMDFAVSNMNAPAALATNRSSSTGHYLNVTLRGQRGARDAIGAVVDVVTFAGRQRQQLLAGDGYMASNERLLQFGLGDSDRISELTVQWPGGASLTLRDLPVDVTLQLIEDVRFATLWSGDHGETIRLP